MKYSLELTKCLAFVVAASRGQFETYTVPLSVEQRAACEQLYASIETGDTLESTQALIHSLSFLLFTHTKVGNVDKYFAPLTRHLVLSSVTSEGDFLKSSMISQKVAAMIYCGRSTVFYQIRSVMEADDEAFFECVQLDLHFSSFLTSFLGFINSTNLSWRSKRTTSCRISTHAKPSFSLFQIKRNDRLLSNFWTQNSTLLSTARHP